MKKALIVTTVSGFVPQFEMNNVHILQEMGYEVHYASNFHNPHYGSDNHRLDGTGIICHQVDFVRSPFQIMTNIKAYKQLQILLKEQSFDCMHCHTPMGGVLGRLAAEHFRKKQTKGYKRKVRTGKTENLNKEKQIRVIYTAHGFHFFRGAPVINWIFYYPVERWLAHFTDILITINEEDYTRARRFHLHSNGRVWKVNGVGIDLEKYQLSDQERKEMRNKLGIKDDEIVFLSVGELNKNKNHQMMIKAMGELKKQGDLLHCKYFICGKGKFRSYLEKKIKENNLTEEVKILGYRSDIKKILAASDIFIMLSKREGLPVSLQEAMASEKPAIVTTIRGNRDLIVEKFGGWLIKKGDYKNLEANIYSILLGKEDLKKMGKYNQNKMKKYSKDAVKQCMKKIYLWNSSE